MYDMTLLFDLIGPDMELREQLGRGYATAYKDIRLPFVPYPGVTLYISGILEDDPRVEIVSQAQAGLRPSIYGHEVRSVNYGIDDGQFMVYAEPVVCESVAEFLNAEIVLREGFGFKVE